MYTLTETRLINDSRSEQNKKNPENPFVAVAKMESYAKFQRKRLKSMVVGARQSSQFSREIAWILGNKRALPKFKYWILHHLINTMKLQNN